MFETRVLSITRDPSLSDIFSCKLIVFFAWEGGSIRMKLLKNRNRSEFKTCWTALSCRIAVILTSSIDSGEFQVHPIIFLAQFMFVFMFDVLLFSLGSEPGVGAEFQHYVFLIPGADLGFAEGGGQYKHCLLNPSQINVWSSVGSLPQ